MSASLSLFFLISFGVIIKLNLFLFLLIKVPKYQNFTNDPPKCGCKKTSTNSQHLSKSECDTLSKTTREWNGDPWLYVIF